MPRTPRSTVTRLRAWVTDHFVGALVAVALGGFVLRVLYLLVVGPRIDLGLDATWYHVEGRILAEGLGYSDPRWWLLTGGAKPTANFPPLWPVVLAGANLVGLRSVQANQYVGALLGSVTVVVTGLIARRVAGPLTAVVAAALVGVSPMLIAADGSLMAESLYVLVITVAVLLAHRALERPTVWRFAAVGAVVGLAVTTRSDALFLAPIMLVALIWTVPGQGAWRRMGLAAALVAALAVPVGTWTIYASARMDGLVLATSNSGNMISGANCPSTYQGRLLGAWDQSCADDLAPDADELAFAAQGRQKGIDHALANPERLPLVAAARVLRMAGLWDPVQTARLEAVETRHPDWQLLAWGWDLVLLGGATVGAVILFRRRVRLAPMVAVVLGVAFTAAVSNGNQRFRLAADPILAIAAAVALAAAVVSLRRRRDRSDDAVTSDRPRHAHCARPADGNVR